MRNSYKQKRIPVRGSADLPLKYFPSKASRAFLEERFLQFTLFGEGETEQNAENLMNLRDEENYSLPFAVFALCFSPSTRLQIRRSSRMWRRNYISKVI